MFPFQQLASTPAFLYSVFCSLLFIVNTNFNKISCVRPKLCSILSFMFFFFCFLFKKKNPHVPFNFLSHREMWRILICPEFKNPLTIYSLLLSTSKTSTDSFSCAYVFLLLSALCLFKFFCSLIAQFLEFMFYFYYVWHETIKTLNPFIPLIQSVALSKPFSFSLLSNYLTPGVVEKGGLGNCLPLFSGWFVYLPFIPFCLKLCYYRKYWFLVCKAALMSNWLFISEQC